MSEVVQSALLMLREAEAHRAAFVATLEDARAEGERDGFFSIEEVEAHVTGIIDGIEARQR